MQSTDCVLKRHFCCERKAYFMRLSTNAKGTTPCNTAGGRVPQERDQHGPRTGSPRAGRSSQGQNSETQAWLDSSAPRSLSLNTLRHPPPSLVCVVWLLPEGRVQSFCVCNLAPGSEPSKLSWLERWAGGCLRPVPAPPCLMWQTLSLSPSPCSPCLQT